LKILLPKTKEANGDGRVYAGEGGGGNFSRGITSIFSFSEKVTQLRVRKVA